MFAACLFPVANGALFVQKKSVLVSESGLVAVTYWPLVLRMLLILYVLNAYGNRYADALISYTRFTQLSTERKRQRDEVVSRYQYFPL